LASSAVTSVQVLLQQSGAAEVQVARPQVQPPSVQAPLQQACVLPQDFPPHVHIPATQASPWAQLFPHAPQLNGSFAVSAQPPAPQQDCPAPHALPPPHRHSPPLHESPVAPHGVSQPPQCWTSLSVEVHSEAQQCSSVLQAAACPQR
jgi:hypothetical protein